MSQPSIIVTITGPSGSGKTVLSKLLKEEGFEPLVSTTTRAPRQGEIEGADYYFVTQEQFLQDLADGKFMENVEYNGVLYGVSVAEAERAFALNLPAVLVAEPHGVEQIAKFCQDQGWGLLRVFVDNEDELLLARLLTRLRCDVSGQDYGDEAISLARPWAEQLKALCVDQAVSTQEEVEQVLKDFLQSLNLPVEQNDATIKASAKRLKSFQFEQQNWVQPARLGGKYDYITASFTHDVEKDVLQDVLQKVQSLRLPPRPKF